MEYLQAFLSTFLYYLRELWFSVALGFFLSGIFYEFIPTAAVEAHLGDRNLKGICLSSLIGTLLPVCCFGSLPIAMTMRRKGAQLGPVLAFLVATPATSIPALIVTWRLLGISFAVYIFFAVIIMSVIVGIIGNGLHILVKIKTEDSMCAHEATKMQSEIRPRNIVDKLIAALRYAFITLPREIGIELLLGVALASFIVIFDPLQQFIHKYFLGMMGYLFIIVSGLATYVCSTASVPLADALLKSGMTPGHAMTYLLVGPITSYGTIFIMWKEFGGRILAVYLLAISFLSFLLGIMYNTLSLWLQKG